MFQLVASAQFYSGMYNRHTYADGRKEIYFCTLKINKDSSIALVFFNKGNDVYNEYTGTIRKINDTLDNMDVISGFITERFRGNYDDTLTIIDAGNFVYFNSIILNYEDGAKISYNLNDKTIRKFDNENSHYRMLRLDPKHFHHKEKMDSYDGIMIRTYVSNVSIDVGHIDPITGKKVLFGVADDGIGFSEGEIKMTFPLVIKGDKIKISADTLTNIGPFTLTKSNQ